MRLADRIWAGDDAADRLGRAVLFPFEIIYRAAVAVRSELYDRSVIEIHASSIPVISIGNLTVGGTGKTPVAGWIASRLAASGMKPAIVLHGYGGDEILVHRSLNPGIAVIADTDRAAGVARAAAGGATVAVLDDGFQHRSARRDADVVLLSADSWTGNTRLLPAGPWREPLSSLARASLVIIIRKAASDASVREAASAAHRVAPLVPRAVIRISMTKLIDSRSPHRSTDLKTISGKKVFAVSAIGDPGAFANQLRQLGATVIERRYADHHEFSESDVATIIAESTGSDLTVCTLKDSVKLEPLWPAEGCPLWYVSQAVTVENGDDGIDRLLTNLESFKSSKPTESGGS